MGPEGLGLVAVHSFNSGISGFFCRNVSSSSTREHGDVVRTARPGNGAK